MNRTIPVTADEHIIDTMIELARCSKSHRIILAGANSRQHMRALHHRAFNRTSTTATCGLPRGQYDAAFIDWQLHSIKALETTLDWLVHFLACASVLVIWTGTREPLEQRKLRTALGRLGFHIEAGTRCEDGLAISARRLDAAQQAIAA